MVVRTGNDKGLIVVSSVLIATKYTQKGSCLNTWINQDAQLDIACAGYDDEN